MVYKWGLLRIGEGPRCPGTLAADLGRRMAGHHIGAEHVGGSQQKEVET